jgi:2'-5' RNA ligase
MNKRLFLALNATEPLSETFLGTYKKLKIYADQRELNIRWVPPTNFHITVSFLGNQPEENIPLIRDALNEACAKFSAFELKIEDVGAFSNEHDARTLWLGVQNKRYLGEFKNYLDIELEERNLITTIDEREFKPHLTFGKLRNPRSVKDMISPFKRKSFGKIQVKEVILYESKMQGPHPVYVPLLRSSLSAETTVEQSIEHSW